MNKYIALISALLLFSLASIFSSAAEPETIKQSSMLTIDQARAIALHAYPGTVTHEEAKKTRRGHVFKYSFDIEGDGLLQNVVIDAKTGKILRYRVKSYQGT